MKQLTACSFLIFLFLFFFLCRETTDTYSISVSPNFGTLKHRSSSRYSFSEVNNNEYMQSDARRSLLSKEDSVDEKYDPESTSVARLSWSEKASLHEQLTGELPISRGCSFSQTIFNGRQADEVAASQQFCSFMISLKELHFLGCFKRVNSF